MQPSHSAHNLERLICPTSTQFNRLVCADYPPVSQFHSLIFPDGCPEAKTSTKLLQRWRFHRSLQTFVVLRPKAMVCTSSPQSMMWYCRPASPLTSFGSCLQRDASLSEQTCPKCQGEATRPVRVLHSSGPVFNPGSGLYFCLVWQGNWTQGLAPQNSSMLDPCKTGCTHKTSLGCCSIFPQTS